MIHVRLPPPPRARAALPPPLTLALPCVGQLWRHVHLVPLHVLSQAGLLLQPRTLASSEALVIQRGRLQPVGRGCTGPTAQAGAWVTHVACDKAGITCLEGTT